MAQMILIIASALSEIINAAAKRTVYFFIGRDSVKNENIKTPPNMIGGMPVLTYSEVSVFILDLKSIFEFGILFAVLSGFFTAF